MQRDKAPLYPTATLPMVDSQSSSPSPYHQPPATAPVQNVGPAQMLLGPENTVTTCQFCHASIKTAVKYTTTTRTHIAAVLYCIACCLCCIGYCSDSTKNSDHYCPNCQRYLGTYKK